MQLWLATGISGSGRIELLNGLAEALRTKGKSARVHDLGALVQDECRHNRLVYSDQRILDLDRSLLRCLRSGALKSVRLAVSSQPESDFHFVGVHATFRWKHRIIPGIAYADMLGLSPSGLLNVVDDLASVYDANHRNPKWRDGGAPSYIETQAWMMEEELVTEVLADVVDRPMFLVARNHHVTNLADLFVTTKKRVYLSYPITAIRTAEPELLQQIQGPILTELESLFVVFDPLAIRDMTLATTNPAPDELDERAISLIKARTVERDFQFIEQCDAVVVAYMTEKLSPGVIAEMQMAHRTQKPIFLAFPGPRSPFLEEVAAVIEPDVESLMPHLRAWAEGGRV